MKRHECIICHKKRYEEYMVETDVGWACKNDGYRWWNGCEDHNDIKIAKEIKEKAKEIKHIKSGILAGLVRNNYR